MLPWRGRIGIIELFGTIRGERHVSQYVDSLTKMEQSQRIKSVVINVDSAGGQAAASHYLHGTVSHLSAQKPVIAFISGSATSGAYLVASTATKIIALPGAIVGSIGAISSGPVIQDLLQRLGIRFAVTKTSPFKDMGAFYRDMTEEEKEKEQRFLHSFHHYFVEAVAKGRHLDEVALKQCVTGEVFATEEAKALGLIDEIGDFSTALDMASELGKVPRRVSYVRARLSLRDKMFSRFTPKFTSEGIVEESLDEVLSLLSRQVWYMSLMK
jgi:protease-4